MLYNKPREGAAQREKKMKSVGTILPTAKSIKINNDFYERETKKKINVGTSKMGFSPKFIEGEYRWVIDANNFFIVTRKMELKKFQNINGDWHSVS